VTGPAQAGVPAVGEAARLFVTGQRMPGAVPECHDDVCITCSDTAVEVTVLRAGMLTIGLAGYSGGKMAGLVSAGEE